MILISGLGSIGRRHLRNLRACGYNDILLYRTGRSTLPDDELEGIPAVYDYEEALAQQPRAVIVANPTAAHLETALPASRAGCYLFLEKPISHNLEGIDELQREVNERGLTVLVGFQFRYHPALRQIKAWLEEGAIGPVVSAQVHWGEYLPAWHPWEDYRKSYSARADLGGGVVLTLCHPFDYLRWLLGEVTAVSAMMGTQSGLQLNVEDTACVTLRFKSGALGQVYLDYAQRPPSHTLHIVGQAGRITWDAADNDAHCYRAEAEGWEVFSPGDAFERNTMFLEEMRHFLDCLEGKEQPCCTLHDGVRALEIVLAAKQSSVEQKTIDV